MKHRSGRRGSFRPNLPVWALVLFCLVIEAAALGVQAHALYPRHFPWFEKLVVALRSGHAVVPANDGPADYRVFRSAGEMAAKQPPARLYDAPLFARFERNHQMKGGPWMYPPPLVPLMDVARLSDFGRGYLIWTALLTLASVLVLRASGLPWPVVLAPLVSPAAIWNFNLGQLGLISSALFVASLVWASDRPTASGILAGLLTMKPQTGLLLPVIYVACRRYRAILMALVTFAVLVAISLAMYGPGVWMAFLHQGLATAHEVLVAAFPTSWAAGGTSIFWMMRSFGFGVTASYAFQAVGAVIAAIWCWLAWRDPAAAAWPRIALTTCLATFVTPYGYVEDLCAFSLGIALLAWYRGRVRPADMLFWVWPAFAYSSLFFLHVLVTPLVILAAAIYAHVEMKRDAPSRRRMKEVLGNAATSSG